MRSQRQLTAGQHSFVWPESRPDLARRVLLAVQEIGRRLPPEVCRMLARNTPAIRLVDASYPDWPRGTLGLCWYERRELLLLWPAFDSMSHAALLGLVTHELGHYHRWATGLMRHDWERDSQGEEDAVDALLVVWGFETESDAVRASLSSCRLWDAVWPRERRR